MATPRLGLGIGVVEEPPPQQVAVAVLGPLPVAGQLEVFADVRVAHAGFAAAVASFEEQGFTQVDTAGSAECRQPPVPCRDRGIAPGQELLGARPDPEHQVDGPVLAQEVAVAVAGEPAGELGDALHLVPGGIGLAASLARIEAWWYGSPTCSAQYFADSTGGQVRQVDGVEQGLVDTLGVHVDLQRPADRVRPLEHRPPEDLVPIVGDAALVVHPERQPVDVGALGEQLGDAGLAVRRVVVRADARDRVAVDRVPAVVVRVVPQAQLELQPPPLALGGDEAQHLQVALLLVRSDALGPYVVAVHVEQERIGEAQVVVGGAVPIGAVVVLHAEREVEPVEPGRGQPGQVVGPELLVVEPGRVLVHAGERPHHAPDGYGGLLGERRRTGEIFARGDSVREFEHTAPEAGLIVADDNDLVVGTEYGVRLGHICEVRGGDLVGGGQPDRWVVGGDPPLRQGLHELLDRPGGGAAGGDGVLLVHRAPITCRRGSCRRRR